MFFVFMGEDGLWRQSGTGAILDPQPTVYAQPFKIAFRDGTVFCPDDECNLPIIVRSEKQ